MKSFDKLIMKINIDSDLENYELTHWIKNLLIKNVNIKDTTMKLSIIDNQLQSRNAFIPDNIIKYIKSINKLYKLEINISNLEIIIKYPYDTDIDIIPIIKKTLFMMYLGKLQDDYITPNKFDITIYPSIDKKYFPMEGKFDIIHVNSGQTTSYYVNNNKITSNIIFRKEELLKVLTHELHHSLEKMIDWDSNLNLNLSRKINLNEAYTEATTIILCIMLSDKPNENYKKELLFSIFQSAKILYLSGITLDDLLGKTDCNKCIVEQNTSVVEYHILKSALIFDLNNFINNIMFKMSKTDFINKLDKTIINNLENKKYRNILNYFINQMQFFSYNYTELFKTGRMSYLF